LHPFNTLAKTFKRFAYPFKKNLHPFNALAKTFQSLLIRLKRKPAAAVYKVKQDNGILF